MLELAESPEGGVRREVHEETGLKVRVDRLTGVYKNTSRGIVALVFLCHVVGGHEQLSDESTAVEWLAPDDIADRMGEVFAIRVRDALDGSMVHVRSHDGRKVIAPSP